MIAPPVWRVPVWESFPGLVHGFYGRQGGHSWGPWASLNLSYKVGDEPEAVERNWELVRRAAGEAGLRIVTMRQVHGAEVARVVAPDPAGDVDAILTSTTGVGLSVLAADCLPALVIAPAARVAAAVHAGWRGTVAGVLPATIAAIKREYGIEPSELHVALGPTIDACCYEVEADIGHQIERAWGKLSPAAWQPSGDKGQLDLRWANAEVAARAGVHADRIHRVGPCTACAAEAFFSHRRDKGRSGRQISLVGWTEIAVVRG